MRKIAPWLLTFIMCAPNVLSGVETVNALTQDKKDEMKISDVKFSKDAIHSDEKMDLSFKIEKSKNSPLERSYYIPKDIEHSLIPTKEKYSIKDKDKEVGEIHFKKDKMLVQWKENTNQQKIQTDCTLEVKAHYYNDEEEINKVKIGKEVTKILPKVEPLKDENLLIQDIHYQPLEQKKENQVVLDLQWPVTAELKAGNQYTFELPKWMEAKKEKISFKDDDKKNWFEAKIQKDQLTLKILKGKVYDPTVYRLPIVFRVNANQNEKVVQWMKHAIPLKKKSIAMDDIDTAAVDTTKETKEQHKQSLSPESEHISTKHSLNSASTTSDSTEDATSTTTTDIQDAIILSHQEVKEGSTEQEEIKIRTAEELLQKNRHRNPSTRSQDLSHSGVVTSVVPSKTELMDGDRLNITVNFDASPEQIHNGDRIEITLPDTSDLTISAYPGQQGELKYGNEVIGRWWVDSSHRVIAEFNGKSNQHSYTQGHFTFECKAESKHRDNPNGDTSYVDTNFGTSATSSHLSVTVPESNSSRGSFYYKTGEMSIQQPNRVQWWLNGNVNQDRLEDDVYIRDQVQKGHVIDWSTMYIYFTGGPLHGKTFSVDEFNRSGYGSIEKISNTNFNVRVSRCVLDPWNRWVDQTGNFTVSYQTIITDPNQETFENHSQVWYRTATESEHWEEHDASVKNIFFDSDVVLGDKDILLKKVDEEDHSKKLQGAEFTLHSAENGQTYKGITDKNGNLIFRNVSPGVYTLQETKAPEGYELDSTIYEVRINVKEVKFKENYSQVIDTKDKIFTITNKKKSTIAVGPKLPKTGGDGYKTWLILVSCTLILGTMVLYIYKKKGTHTQ